MDDIAEQTEQFLRQYRHRGAYGFVRKLRCKRQSSMTPVKDASGQLLADRAAQLARWTEYFSGPPPTISSEDLDLAAEQARPDPSISVEEPCLSEVQSAIKGMKNNKAPEDQMRWKRVLLNRQCPRRACFLSECECDFAADGQLAQTFM